MFERQISSVDQVRLAWIMRLFVDVADGFENVVAPSPMKPEIQSQAS